MRLAYQAAEQRAFVIRIKGRERSRELLRTALICAPQLFPEAPEEPSDSPILGEGIERAPTTFAELFDRCRLYRELLAGPGDELTGFLGPADSLRTLLDLAGGPVPAAQAGGCLLVRFQSPTEAESLWFQLPDVYSGKANPALRDGDHAFIFFTSRYHALEMAGVYGEIENPGVYPLVSGQSRLSHLIRAAHGFLPRADLSTIRVIRAERAPETDPEFERLIRLSRDQMTNSEYEILRAKLAARKEDYRVDWFRLEQSPELDILLRDKDVIRVDPLLASVRVEGEVRRPGIVEFAPRRSVDAYVKLAGGYSNRAATSKVRINRAVTGQSLRAKDVQEVAPGDLIWVPERPDVTVWQHLQTLITVAAQVATLVIAVRR